MMLYSTAKKMKMIIKVLRVNYVTIQNKIDAISTILETAAR